MRVSNGPMTNTCSMPMLEAGSAGRIVFGFYGTSASGSQPPQSDGAQWHYFQVRCNNALDATPVFEQVQVSDHVMHTGRICEDGINCAAPGWRKSERPCDQPGSHQRLGPTEGPRLGSP